MNDIFKLDAVSEGSAGGDDRILKPNASDLDPQIGVVGAGGLRFLHRGPPDARRTGARASVSTRPTA